MNRNVNTCTLAPIERLPNKRVSQQPRMILVMCQPIDVFKMGIFLIILMKNAPTQFFRLKPQVQEKYSMLGKVFYQKSAHYCIVKYLTIKYILVSFILQKINS